MADIRKNAASLTTTERNNFLRALFLLKHKASPVAGLSIYDQFVALHGAVMAVVTAGQTINFGHWNLAFCPWHREYLRRFEFELQKEVPGVTVPYWDWSNHTLARQRVFTSAFMGGLVTGNPRPTSTGTFTFNAPSPRPSWYPSTAVGWRIAGPLQELQYPAGTPNKAQLDATLHRGSSGEVWPASAAALTRLGRLSVNRPPYHKMWFFWNQLEAGVPDQGSGEIPTHNAGHRFIGGHMGGAFSPNDAIFWLHHSNVDRLWAQWQAFQLTQGAVHPRTADYPPAGQLDPWDNSPIPLGHNLGDEMWPWVSNPGAYTLEDPSVAPLLAGFPSTPVRKVQDVLDPAVVGYGYA